MNTKTRWIMVVSLLIMGVFAGCQFTWTPQPEVSDRPFSRAVFVENALRDPGFEGPFREVDGIHELKVAAEWQPWWDPRDTRPEYKRADLATDARRVHSGQAAQQWFSTYSTHTAGVYQKLFGLPCGAKLTFSAWMQAFTSNKNDFDQSEGKYRMRIGIDPYGGTDPESPDVVWSNDGHAIEPYDKYYFLSVETVARSDRATVFIWGQPEWALKHNNAYVDDTALKVEMAGTPDCPPCIPCPDETPEPCPTDIPRSCPSLKDIQGVVEDELKKREPVIWPR